MASILNVANEFIRLAKKEGEQLTNLKLQKLCFLAYGKYMGKYGDRLVSDDCPVAWRIGGIFEKLYNRLVPFGCGFITENMETEEITSVKEKICIKVIWDFYKRYTALGLVRLTHKDDAPWTQVWDNGRGRNNIIPDDLIREYYKF